MNCDECTHSIMPFPLFSVCNNRERKRESPRGKLFSFCFYVNDTYSLCHDTPVLCQGFFPFKVSEVKLPCLTKVARDSVSSAVVTDSGTVSGWALDHHPFFAEEMLESCHIFPKVSCRHYSLACCKARGRLHAQPTCALEGAVSFSPLMLKSYFLFFHWDCLKHDQSFKRL